MEFAIKIQGLILAQFALMESYKVANIMREQQGYSLAYGEEAFSDIYMEIQRLASQIVV